MQQSSADLAVQPVQQQVVRNAIIFTNMVVDKSLLASIDAAIVQFNEDGYGVIPNFLSESEIHALQTACAGIIEHEIETKDLHVFSAGDNQDYVHGDDYFLSSNDKIRLFYELGAVKSLENREFVVEDRHQRVNKIGHALHWLDPTFKAVSHSEKIKAVCRALSLQDPRIVQSMYIFKQPGIGGAVSLHKDSTFLNTDPTSRLIGLWFALEDATLENGCLWFAKGTHREQPTQFMVLNEAGKTPRTIFRGKNRDYRDEEFTAAPVKAGSLVLIHANVTHKSEHNFSTKSRHAYTFHIIDFGNGTKYNDENWLAPSTVVPFQNIYNVPNEKL